MLNLGTSMFLIVPDIHFDAAFLRKILRRHAREQVRGIILLGDYFDSRDARLDAEGPAAICGALNRLVAERGDSLTLLMGNHDFPYWQCFAERRVIPYPEFETSQYSTLHAEVILEKLDARVWNRMRFLHTEGRVIFSHAGLNAPLLERWRFDRVFRARLRRLAHPPQRAFRQKSPEIFAVGAPRGGFDPLGGLLWQDWREWTALASGDPEPGAPWQVFGHTSGPIRTYGNAVCLDAHRTAYATWDEEGFVARSADTGMVVQSVSGFPSPPKAR